jgi:hypothetical protein
MNDICLPPHSSPNRSRCMWGGGGGGGFARSAYTGFFRAAVELSFSIGLCFCAKGGLGSKTVM